MPRTGRISFEVAVGPVGIPLPEMPAPAGLRQPIHLGAQARVIFDVHLGLSTCAEYRNHGNSAETQNEQAQQRKYELPLFHIQTYYTTRKGGMGAATRELVSVTG